MKSPKNSAAFTLTELLTVIAIIGVLAGILIPVVGAARQSARASQCASNLRQIGAALRLFAAENRNHLPVTYNLSNAATNNWWYHLNPYTGNRQMKAYWTSASGPGSVQEVSLDDKGIYRCPQTEVTNNGWGGNHWVSYKMNSRFREDDPNRSTYNASTVQGFPLAMVVNPSRCIAVLEGRTHPEFDSYNEATSSANAFWVIYPHKGNLNALFVDGHVRSMNRQALQADWLTYRRPLGNP